MTINRIRKYRQNTTSNIFDNPTHTAWFLHDNLKARMGSKFVILQWINVIRQLLSKAWSTTVCLAPHDKIRSVFAMKSVGRNRNTSWSTHCFTGNIKQMHGNSKKVNGRIARDLKLFSPEISQAYHIKWRGRWSDRTALFFLELYLLVFYKTQMYGDTIITLFSVNHALKIFAYKIQPMLRDIFCLIL